jgi:hypothetical protein
LHRDRVLVRGDFIPAVAAWCGDEAPEEDNDDEVDEAELIAF